MKKFLSVLGVSILSLSLLAGCGSKKETTTEATTAKATTAEATTEAVADSAQAGGEVSADSQKKIQDATCDYVAATLAIVNNATSISKESMAEFQTVAQELMAFSTELQQNAAELQTNPAKVDEVVTKYQEFADRIKAIAEANGIEVTPITVEELPDALSQMQQGLQNLLAQATSAAQ